MKFRIKFRIIKKAGEIKMLLLVYLFIYFILKNFICIVRGSFVREKEQKDYGLQSRIRGDEWNVGY